MSISSKTKRLLLARSGGYCQNPECNKDLYPYFEDGTITNIEELAHIIAKSEGGARGDEPLPLDQRDEYDNIILLCPTCHTIIDKNSEKYPSQVLKKWKREHEDKIKSNFHVSKYKDRSELRVEIQKLLAENHEIFRQYGPQSDFAKGSSQSEASKMSTKGSQEPTQRIADIVAYLHLIT
jgi:5-methylcytosine-specific restriction endonuclease McrA